MTLRTLFATPIIVILLVTLSLAGMIVSQEWYGHQRGAIAIAATGRASLLNELEGQVGNERLVTWDASGAKYPLPDPIARQLARERGETGRIIDALFTLSRTAGLGKANDPEPFLPEVQANLAA